jgi:hypothetical protein
LSGLSVCHRMLGRCEIGPVRSPTGAPLSGYHGSTPINVD